MAISQLLRPHDQVRFMTPYYALAPIAGMQMSEEVAAIGDQLLWRCNRAEWEEFESGYVFKDWHPEYYHANPVFLFKQFDSPIPSNSLYGIFHSLARDSARLITACRLYKTGRLLEPVYTVRFCASDKLYHRAVGAYRTEYLAMPVDGMTWTLAGDEAEDVGLIYGNLETMEQTGGTELLRSVIHQFNLSHTPAVTPYFSVHVLFTSLELLFDGVDKRVALKTTRYERASQVLRWGEGSRLDPAIETFYLEQAHSLRNAIHHHALRKLDVDLGEARFRLQLSLMMGIRLLMRLHRKEVEDSLIPLKTAEGWLDLGPKDFLNLCLDRHFHGDPGPLQAAMKLQV